MPRERGRALRREAVSSAASSWVSLGAVWDSVGRQSLWYASAHPARLPIFRRRQPDGAGFRPTAEKFQGHFFCGT